ncbi:D-aminoacyl-tRNA deacylase [Salinigranum marinum]|uniref:D-aminoacyl-tRNA deacylase n=1 Tax=Salinigranum marinum TaxID=1515595 RepID=UPI002989BF64|nr:D-aminoacyl-tRNA deacylase [Salinigranum marinum]
MIALVVSRADRASEHIGEHALELVSWDEHVDEDRPAEAGGGTYYRRPGFELRTFDELHLRLDDAADAFTEPSLLLFLSRHSGETGPLLSAHFTGNFGPAEYGGSDGELARACPRAQQAVVAALDRHAPDGYDVGIECTHHGPSRIGVPSMFVELGSSDEEWDDPNGARAVARAVLDLSGVPADRTDGDRTRHVVGFGGGHYAPRFERIVRETDWAVGHVGADWPLDAMGHPREHPEVVRGAFEASAADLAVVDGDRPSLVDVVREEGFRVVSETFLRATEGVPRTLVSRVEDALGSVDDGVRFGDHAQVGVDDGSTPDDSDGDGSCGVAFTVVDLPAGLLDEALGIDQAATRAAVAAHTVGYHTDENGRRPAGRAAFPRAADGGAERAEREGKTTAAYDRLVEALCDVLRGRYDEVVRDGDSVVARESAFDPEAAATLGVEAGPAFGRLAAGDPVEVGGRRIDPDAVHRERTVNFRV